jgi:hypothetical protein
MRFETGEGVSYFRIALPTQLRPQRFDHAGTWYAILTIGRPHLEPERGNEDGVDLSILRGRRQGSQRSVPPRRLFEHERAIAVVAAESAMPTVVKSAVSERAAAARALPYSLVVHAYSNVSLRAAAQQTSYEPGAEVELRAIISQSGIPGAVDPYVWADITRPDGATSTLELLPDGEFRATFVANWPGVYRARVRARGRTRRGLPFVRERTLTVPVWRGGDTQGGPGDGGPGRQDEAVCRLLSCLAEPGKLIDKELEERLRRLGINLDAARKCLAQACNERAQG